MFFPRSLVKIQYCGEPLWPRGSFSPLDRQGLNFASCSILNRFLTQLSMYVHSSICSSQASKYKINVEWKLVWPKIQDYISMIQHFLKIINCHFVDQHFLFSNCFKKSYQLLFYNSIFKKMICISYTRFEKFCSEHILHIDSAWKGISGYNNSFEYGLHSYYNNFIVGTLLVCLAIL